MSDSAIALGQALATGSAHTQALAERIQAELGFANTLCELHPRRAAAWRPLIARAAEAAARGTAGGRAEFAAAVAAAEAAMAPLAKAAKAYTVYCVGHGHIDMNWMWSWPETVAVTHDTFATVLRLMDEFPTFRYSQSQASVYAILEQHHPEMLARVAERVREGRWEVTASHWVEGEKNIAGGEALCRHLLYTRRYMQQLFGLAPEDVPIDWSPDTFGHAHTVPTYLVRGGVRYLYLHRPGSTGPARPRAFHWRAPDGSQVLVKNDMELGYNGVIAPGLTRPLANFAQETGLTFGLFVYGVGDHGGGPTRRDLLRALDMDRWPVFPHLTFATAKSFFERLAAEGAKLPVLDCELNFEFTGCYTTQTVIKRDNRFGEKHLAAAETASALAWAGLAHPYPTARFETGWRDTLFSHFHDILPGSGVHDTRTYTHGLYQQTMAMTAAEEAGSLRALARHIDTRSAGPLSEPDLPPARLPTALGSGVGFGSVDGNLSQAEQSAGHGNRPFVVANPTAVDRAEVVEVTVWDNAHGWRRHELPGTPFSVVGPDGAVQAAQTLEVGSYWAHDFVRLAFRAEVPACGYALYTVREERAAPAPGGQAHQLGRGHHCSYAFYERSPEGLENDRLRVEIDPATGGIRSLVETASGTALIAADAPAPALEYAVERPHGMTAWTVDHTGPVEAPEVLGVHRRLNGPYTATLDVRLRIHESEFTLTYELRAGDPRLHIHLAGTWFQRGTPQTGVPVLRLAYPFALAAPRASYEIPFGAIDRCLPDGEEVPALRWAMVRGAAAGQPAGCLLLNDSKHGHSLTGSTLRLTLIRSSYDPDPLPEIGRHEVHVALLPFAGDLPVADAVRAGMVFENSLRPVGTDIHKGTWPVRAGLLSPEPASVILGAVKKAEADHALLLRFFDPTGRTTTAKATLDAALLGTVAGALEVDLLERPVARSTAKVRGNTVSVRLPARGIASVLVRLRKPAKRAR